jgi:glutathione S-transferase
MSLTLHYHPLSSFCWKVLIALHENDIPCFQRRPVE